MLVMSSGAGKLNEGVAYIDGGISDNFPVLEMRKKGVAIIIGVDVQGELESKEDVNSAIDILNQIVNFQMYARDDEKLSTLDIHVAPNFDGFSVTSFDRIDEIIDIGEKAASLQKELFEKIGNSQKEKPALKENEEAKKYTLANFKTPPLKNFSRSFILGKLKLQKGDVVTHGEKLTDLSYLNFWLAVWVRCRGFLNVVKKYLLKAT